MRNKKPSFHNTGPLCWLGLHNGLDSETFPGLISKLPSWHNNETMCYLNQVCRNLPFWQLTVHNEQQDFQKQSLSSVSYCWDVPSSDGAPLKMRCSFCQSRQRIIELLKFHEHLWKCWPYTSIFIQIQWSKSLWSRVRVNSHGEVVRPTV